MAIDIDPPITPEFVEQLKAALLHWKREHAHASDAVASAFAQEQIRLVNEQVYLFRRIEYAEATIAECRKQIAGLDVQIKAYIAGQRKET